MAEQLRFTKGDLKGRPLETAGVPYRITKYKGQDVALFNNGQMAYFERVEIPDPPLPKIQKPFPIATPASRELIRRMPQRMTIAAYRTEGNFRPRWGPVYGVYDNGELLYNVSRAEVGADLREFLWLFEKLREFGRGFFAALREAWILYRIEERNE